MLLLVLKNLDVRAASNISVYDQEFTKYIEKTSDL